MDKGLIDYHVHTKMCRHASGEIHEYIEYAIKKQLSEIGFADHFPMFYLPEAVDTTYYCMLEEEVPIYIKKIKNMQEKYQDIEIKIATEVDYYTGKEKIIKNAIKKYDFDYIIGSVHVVDDWCIDDSKNISIYEKVGIINVYEKYFSALKKAIESKIFDIIGHLDLVKKFGFRPNKNISYLIDPIIESIKKNKVCIELNTSGDRKPVNEFYPSRHILKKCFENDIAITIGSDAHKPEEVGWKFNDGLKLLREIGYTQIVKFRARKIEFMDI
ncbi:MAG: histidinol-phosphatase HisJ [Candidatus Helarchaeota archaeon]